MWGMHKPTLRQILAEWRLWIRLRHRGELGNQGACTCFSYDFANAAFGILGKLCGLWKTCSIFSGSHSLLLESIFLCVYLFSTTPESLLSECLSEPCFNYCGSYCNCFCLIETYTLMKISAYLATIIFHVLYHGVFLLFSERRSVA